MRHMHTSYIIVYVDCQLKFLITRVLTIVIKCLVLSYVTEYEKRDHLVTKITFLFVLSQKEAQSELSNALFSVIN